LFTSYMLQFKSRPSIYFVKTASLLKKIIKRSETTLMGGLTGTTNGGEGSRTPPLLITLFALSLFVIRFTTLLEQYCHISSRHCEPSILRTHVLSAYYW